MGETKDSEWTKVSSGRSRHRMDQGIQCMESEKLTEAATMTEPPPDFFKHLPESLPQNEPYYYLSAKQRNICSTKSSLSAYAPHLPGWVPHRRVADALNHTHAGINAALNKLAGQPYVWGTEFENVHSFWEFSEPRFVVAGTSYCCSEDYFHKQKPRPFDARLWDGESPGSGKRDEVMRIALRCKFSDSTLQQLLMATHPHPLLSIKGDAYWGVMPTGRGENMLAKLLMELRSELVATSERHSSPPSAETAALSDPKELSGDGVNTGRISAPPR